MANTKRPETFAEARDRLSWLEWLNIRFVRWTFSNRLVDRIMVGIQHSFGVSWVHHCTKNLMHAHGTERIQPLIDAGESIVFVSNHRSFFDMYVVNMLLIHAGFAHRLLYPVRSKFFYDHPLGFFVNGIMSWFCMYPPIFKDRKRLLLNHVAFTELSKDLTGGRSIGIHPEGTRKKDDDPYTFLKPQPGVGRLIHLSGAKVVPVFVNGLGNDLPRQVASNFDGTGTPIVVVFGEPIDFDDLRGEPGASATYKAIAERCMSHVGELGQQEKAIRADLDKSDSVPASAS